MSELFSWFAQLTREHFGAVAETGQDSPRNFISGAGFSAKPPSPPEFASGLGHQPTSVDAGNGGEVPNALPPSKDSCGDLEQPIAHGLGKNVVAGTCGSTDGRASNQWSLSLDGDRGQTESDGASAIGRADESSSERKNSPAGIISIESGLSTKRNEDAQCETGAAKKPLKFSETSAASVIDIELTRVQRVMEAHNYAGSHMSRARFDAEVSLGIERMREKESEGWDE